MFPSVTSLSLTPVPANRWKNQSGAFDLPSIITGVVVVGILTAGVLAAIFGVIPWAQSRAVKQDLAAVNTAQGVSYAKDGGFQAKTGLVNAGLLGSSLPEDLDVRADSAGECYVAVGAAGSGEKFLISNEETSPRELTYRDKWCDGQIISPDLEPVMITTWDTSLAETCKEIALPVTDLKGTVTWGDGTIDNATSHTYTGAGPVAIRIDGTFTKWSANNNGWKGAECLVSVDRWGETGTKDLSYAFYNAVNLKHVESIPSTTEYLSHAFSGATADFTIGQLNTSNVAFMDSMFSYATAFNQPVDFDTSKVRNMSNMFASATAFNQPVNFDTSKVATLYQMFRNASTFNQPVNFNTSKVTDMSYMFTYAEAFNQPVNFDTSKVTTMQGMFGAAKNFDQPVKFDTSSVTNMAQMFFNTPAFNQPVNFDTSKVTTMSSMFSSALAFNQPVNFDTSKVTIMSSMFSGAKALNRPVHFTDTSKVTSMASMFISAPAFNQPLDFDTSNVTTMSRMFYGASAFNQDLSTWNVSKVTDNTSFSFAASNWKLPQPKWVN